MPKNKKLINLLPQEEFEQSTMGRVLKWITTSFRYIVILVEMVVMGAFLSRFWLDAQNSDLSETLKSKVSQVDSQKRFEEDFRSLQNKLKIYKDLQSQQKTISLIKDISSRVPTDVVLQGISMQEQSIQIKATSLNEIGTAQFVSNLQNNKDYKQVTLGQTNTQESNKFMTGFTIQITY